VADIVDAWNRELSAWPERAARACLYGPLPERPGPR